MTVVKAVLDRLGAAVALVLLSPVFAAIVVWIWLDDGRPALIAQERAGRDGKPFRMLKFRTMVVDALEVGKRLGLEDPWGLLPDDPRITRSGRFLRRTSLDELPQLINVLKGEMSLVGPRPEQVELVKRYRPEHRFRLAVKPGLTGPMQVFGRGALSFEERLAVERDYIENLSLSRDLRILALTVPSVLCGRGAY